MTLKLLGGLVTDWTVLGSDNPDQIPSWGVLRQLTNMTRLELLDALDSNCYLEELQYLTKLHTLQLFNHGGLAYKVLHFTDLLRLELGQGLDVVYDFSCLMQLTALILMEEANQNFCSLVLPECRDVGLQHLYVSCCDKHARVKLLNLGLAVRLTSIHLNYAFPDDLTPNIWPQAMPCLSHLTVQQLDKYCCPPLELLLYSRLRHLDLFFVFLQTLPDFFTGLTQLEHLVLYGHSFHFCFPHPVLALSQLQTLDMSSPAVMDLPETLVNCATWPNLISLDLGLTGDDLYSMDSQMVLLLLGNAIKESGSRVHLIVDEIYT